MTKGKNYPLCFSFPDRSPGLLPGFRTRFWRKILLQTVTWTAPGSAPATQSSYNNEVLSGILSPWSHEAGTPSPWSAGSGSEASALLSHPPPSATVRPLSSPPAAAYPGCGSHSWCLTGFLYCILNAALTDGPLAVWSDCLWPPHFPYPVCSPPDGWPDLQIALPR